MSFLANYTFASLKVEREDDLLWVSLNEPDRANALSPRMIAEITDLYESDLRSEGVRAILLSGEGKNFSAGADLEHLQSLRGASYERNLEDSEGLKRLFESILRQDALTFAMVHGACVAGGCGLATACDFILAAEDARFMYSEVRIGFVAALVATYLSLRVRGSHLRELLLDPEFIAAPKAAAMGLVNRTVSRENLRPAAKTWAHSILAKASSESIARSKSLILEVMGQRLGDALQTATETNAASRLTADCQKGIAHFLETKRSPNWRE